MGRRKREILRDSERKWQWGLAFNFVMFHCLELQPLIVTGLLQIKVVPYSTKEELEAKGINTEGKFFASFESFSNSNNPSNIWPQLVFDTATIFVSVSGRGPPYRDVRHCCLELVYIPNMHLLRSKLLLHNSVLYKIKKVSHPFPECQSYRMKQGKRFVESISLTPQTIFIARVHVWMGPQTR